MSKCKCSFPLPPPKRVLDTLFGLRDHEQEFTCPECNREWLLEYKVKTKKVFFGLFTKSLGEYDTPIMTDNTPHHEMSFSGQCKHGIRISDRCEICYPPAKCEHGVILFDGCPDCQVNTLNAALTPEVVKKLNAIQKFVK
jgi:hypothetical protein